MSNQLDITEHARKRMAQRNVSENEVSFILEHGQMTHCAGAILVTCRRKDIPKNKLVLDEFRRLDGVTIVMSRENSAIMTVWRNRKQGLRHIRHKPRYRC